MAEPVTTLGLGALAAYLGKDGLQKLLGPTAEYLGTGLKDLTQKRAEAIGRIFENASKKVGDGIKEEKSVPPKVLKEILDDGSFSDETIEIEYLGGVLASSRSGVSRDNRGAAIARLVNSLSNYQLRAHYLVYSTVIALFRDSGILYDVNARRKMKILIALQPFVEAMEFNGEELSRLPTLLSHIFFGLHQQSLIEEQFMFGPPEGLQEIAPGATVPGIVCQPSALGFEIMLWAFGEGNREPQFIFDPAFSPVFEGAPFGIRETRPVSDLS